MYRDIYLVLSVVKAGSRLNEGDGRDTQTLRRSHKFPCLEMVASFLLHAGRETDGKNNQIGLAFDCSLASRAVTPSSDSMGCYFLWEGS